MHYIHKKKNTFVIYDLHGNCFDVSKTRHVSKRLYSPATRLWTSPRTTGLIRMVRELRSSERREGEREGEEEQEKERQKESVKRRARGTEITHTQHSALTGIGCPPMMQCPRWPWHCPPPDPTSTSLTSGRRLTSGPWLPRRAARARCVDVKTLPGLPRRPVYGLHRVPLFRVTAWYVLSLASVLAPLRPSLALSPRHCCSFVMAAQIRPSRGLSLGRGWSAWSCVVVEKERRKRTHTQIRKRFGEMIG